MRFCQLVTSTFVCALMAGGCAHGLRPGNLDKVRPVSEGPRVGNVYLVRGFIGVFSTGIDDLRDQLRDVGMHAYVFQSHQRSALARRIQQEYANHPNPEPLVLVGHSYGADDVVRIARDLDRFGIAVDLLVTLDPVTPPPVPPNVRHALNIYQSNRFWDRTPFLRGVPVTPADGFSGQVTNYDIRVDRQDLLHRGTSHFNIEKQTPVQEEVIGHVLIACPPRETFADHRGRRAYQPPDDFHTDVQSARQAGQRLGN